MKFIFSEVELASAVATRRILLLLLLLLLIVHAELEASVAVSTGTEILREMEFDRYKLFFAHCQEASLDRISNLRGFIEQIYKILSRVEFF